MPAILHGPLTNLCWDFPRLIRAPVRKLKFSLPFCFKFNHSPRNVTVKEISIDRYIIHTSHNRLGTRITHAAINLYLKTGLFFNVLIGLLSHSAFKSVFDMHVNI